jgi:hypothetical protein
LILLDKVHQFVVCDDLLVLVLIDGNLKLDMVIGMADVGLMVGNVFNNVGAEPLTVFLSVHEEGVPQQFLWVDNNHVISLRLVRCGFRIIIHQWVP